MKKNQLSALLCGVCAGIVLVAVAAPQVQAAPLVAGHAPHTLHAPMIHHVSADNAAARKFIENMATQAIDFLGDPKMAQDAKRRAFEKLLNDAFDMETIGRFALGRYWRTATEAQRKEYMTSFRRMVISVYSARFSEYNGQRFDVRSARAEGERDVLVTSFIVPPSGPEIQVDWRVRERNGRWRVIDIIVEGVSMSVTQRSDFASVIQRGGGDVEVLLTHLRK